MTELVISATVSYSNAMLVTSLNVVITSVTFATSVSTMIWLGPEIVVVRLTDVVVVAVIVDRVVNHS